MWCPFNAGHKSVFSGVSSRSATPFSAVESSTSVAQTVPIRFGKRLGVCWWFLFSLSPQPGRQPDATVHVIQAKCDPKYVGCCLIYANGSKVLPWCLHSSKVGSLAVRAGGNLKSCSVRGLTFVREILCPIFFLIYICKINKINWIFPSATL